MQEGQVQEEQEIRNNAIERVKSLGIKASDEEIARWVDTVGPAGIMESTPEDIRAVCDAF